VAKLGANGRFVVYSSVRTDVLVDVVGWLPIDSDFAAVTPGRLLDTRPGMETVDGLQAGVGRMAAGTTIDIEIGGRSGVPADGAGSVMLNVTAVDPAGPRSTSGPARWSRTRCSCSSVDAPSCASTARSTPMSSSTSSHGCRRA
jgi:hypothetical protein